MILSSIGLVLGLAFLALWVFVRVFGVGSSGTGPAVGRPGGSAPGGTPLESRP